MKKQPTHCFAYTMLSICSLRQKQNDLPSSPGFVYEIGSHTRTATPRLTKLYHVFSVVSQPSPAQPACRTSSFSQTLSVDQPAVAQRKTHTVSNKPRSFERELFDGDEYSESMSHTGGAGSGGFDGWVGVVTRARQLMLLRMLSFICRRVYLHKQKGSLLSPT